MKTEKHKYTIKKFIGIYVPGECEKDDCDSMPRYGIMQEDRTDMYVSPKFHYLCYKCYKDWKGKKGDL